MGLGFWEDAIDILATHYNQSPGRNEQVTKLAVQPADNMNSPHRSVSQNAQSCARPCECSEVEIIDKTARHIVTGCLILEEMISTNRDELVTFVQWTMLFLLNITVWGLGRAITNRRPQLEFPLASIHV